MNDISQANGRTSEWANERMGELNGMDESVFRKINQLSGGEAAEAREGHFGMFLSLNLLPFGCYLISGRVAFT